MINLPQIYPIIDIPFISLHETESVAKAMVAGGAKIVQLRAKGIGSRDFLEAAKLVRNITFENGVLFIVNDRVDIVILSKADGVHLGQDDLPVKDARRLLGKNAIIGFSTHNIREARSAARLPIDYISFGPVFPTKTKPDAETPKGLKVIAEARNSVAIPMVAIGGINETNMHHVLKEGAQSAAMISDILTSSDIANKIHRLISIAQGLKIRG